MLVIISDCKPGHYNRCHAVAKAVGADQPKCITLNEEVRDIGPEEQRIRSLVLSKNYAGAEWVAESLIQYTDIDSAELAQFKQAGRDSLVVAAGTPACVFALLLGSETGMFTIAGGLRPMGSLYRRFDLCVFPFYELPLLAARTNVLLTDFPTAFHDGKKRQGEERVWLLAIGGPSSECEWDTPQFDAYIRVISREAEKRDVSLWVTLSRRTPESIRCSIDRLSRKLPFVKDVTKTVRFPDMLETADKVFLTEDSMSMLGEAINAGHIPGVLCFRTRENIVRQVNNALQRFRVLSRRSNARYAVDYAHRKRLSHRLLNDDLLLRFCDMRSERFGPNLVLHQWRGRLLRRIEDLRPNSI